MVITSPMKIMRMPKEYALNENLQDIAIYLLASDINFANYKCVEDYK